MSFKGIKFILVMICLLTRFTVLVPLRNRSSKAIALALVNHWFAYFGMPRRFVVDNEAGIFPQDVREQLFQISHLEIHRTIPYVSGGKALVERTNRTINHMLKRSLSQGVKDWPRHLSFITNTLNNTVNRTTRFSPSQLALGRNTTVFDYDDGRHRNLTPPEDMDTSWKSHLDVIRGIIYPLVCNNIEVRRAQVREAQETHPNFKYLNVE